MIRIGSMALLALASPLAAQDSPAAFDAARTAPLAVGQWVYATTATGSEARFGMHFLIRCDRSARRVTLRPTGPNSAVPATAMTITTDLATRTIPADGVVTNIDAVLDAIAFSRGRFIVDGGGSGGAGSGARLVLPASPEAARSIDDCRN